MNLRINVGVLFLFWAACLGCGDGNSPEAAIARSNKTNIQRLANMYQAYQFSHRYKGPASEKELRDFVSGMDVSRLNKRGIDPDNLDELFVCERDGQPFVFRWGVASGPHGSKEAVVFEKDGVSGKRMVAFLNMVQREVDDDEYERLLNEKVSSKPKSGNQGRQQ